MRRCRLALYLALLPLLALGCGKKGASAADITGGKVPVIVISVDTLRADHLPLYGYRGVETPAFQALRNDSVLFTNAYSHVPLTLPSHLTMLTGLLPQDHGVRDNIGYPFDPSKHLTIPAFLKAQGYATGAAISAYILRGSTGIGGVFDYFDDPIAVTPGTAIGELARPGDQTVASALQWITAHQSAPFFFFLHLFEPHSPYAPAEPFRTRYASSPYDGEIATADDIVGKFVAGLKADGVYDKSLIIFMSDHGEGLMEHGEEEHGILLYREDIHVPLLMKLPGSKLGGTTVETPAQLIDIFPTVAKFTTGSVPPGLTGKSLVDLATAPVDLDRKIFSETLYPRIHLGWSDLRSMAGAQFHYIAAPRPELYDFAADPGERANVLTAQRRVYGAMKKELDRYGSGAAAPENVDPEEAKKLAALGYLNATGPSMSGDLPDPKDRIGDIQEVKDAFRLAAQRRLPEAVDALNAALKRNPNWTDAWSKLGQTYEEMGQYDKAAETYKKAIKASPSLASEFALSLATVDERLGRLDEAAANAQLAAKANPAATHLAMGHIAFTRGDLKGARAEADQTLRYPSHEMQATLLLAQIDEAENALPQALARLDALAARVNTGHLKPVADLQFLRGDTLARMNRGPEAEAAFRREIRDFPLIRQAYANLALVYMLEHRQGDAKAVLEEMVGANPGPESALLAAKTLDTLGDATGAAAWRRRAAAGQSK
jgi:choline-sulfatase